MRKPVGVCVALSLVALPFVCGAAVPKPGAVDVEPARNAAVYWLDAGSVFAEGCLGSDGGMHGCMCPLTAAEDFRGRFELTLNPHTPPGHRAYDVVVLNWVVTMDGEEFEVTGTGYYDTWTDLHGDTWTSMTLDLLIYDEEVHFSSGAVAGGEPSASYPQSVQISLESDTDCFGYLIVIDGPRFRRILQQQPEAQ